MVDDRVPSQQIARGLVVSIAVFWTTWGCIVVGAELGMAAAIIISLGLVCMASGFLLYATLFRIWNQPFLPVGFRGALLSWGIMMKLFSPRWLWQTVRATEWPSALVAWTLLALLATDLVLFGFLMSRPLIVSR